MESIKKHIPKTIKDFLRDKKLMTKSVFYLDSFFALLIIISAFIFVAETYVLPDNIQTILRTLDIIIIAIFTIEYLARIYIKKKSTRYIFSWLGIIDLLSFAPFWISIFVPWVHTLQFLRVLRIFKLFRFFNRYLAKKHVRKELVAKVLITKMIFIVFVLIFVSSSLIFILEAPHNPQINTFDDAAYFALVTMTAVGYGDIAPMTKAGRLIIVGIIMFGVLIIPIYIASLMRAYSTHTHKKISTCSGCGHRYHEEESIHCNRCGTRL